MSNKPKEEINYCFLVEWFDSQADLVRKYQLFYFTSDNTIEMFDTKNRRTFLKRCPYPSIKLPDLCIGAQIAVYSRQLKVVAYGDDFTRKKLESQQERTFTLIKPDAYDRIGKILDTAVQNGMIISRIKMCRLSSEQASNFLGKPVNHPEVASFSCGPSVAVELVGVNAVDKWSSLQLKGVYSSLQQAAADKECSFFFDNPAVRPSAHMQSCTVAIIKPHLVQAGAVGKIVDAVLAKGYEVSAIELFQLPKQSAEEFLEVYQTVVPEYFAMAEQLASGPCVVLEIKGDDKIVSTFREFVGPMDPEIAKHIRPNTLRAQYGVDRVKNGIHCTDLPEDGQLESEFFFSIMQPQA